MTNFDVPILVLHGLGERTWSLYFFITFLKHVGFHNIYAPHWPANSCSMPEQCMARLEPVLNQWINKSDPFYVIGNSMGGVMAYHLPNYGWNVSKAIYIAAPLNGSSVVKWANTVPLFGSQLAQFAVGPGSYLYLSAEHELRPPPHEYWTITRSLLPGFEFDGHVFHSEAIIEESRDVFSPYSTHFALIVESSVWLEISRRLRGDDTLIWEQQLDAIWPTFATFAISTVLYIVFFALWLVWHMCAGKKKAHSD